MYTTSDLAKIFKVNGVTITNWVKKYDIPHSTTLGGHMRFTDESIEEIKKLIKEKYNLK